jgi:fatty acid desaturase
MLSKEDSRRLAQLERQLRRDDPDFCARMRGNLPARRRMPLSLILTAAVIWAASLVLAVSGWWGAAAVAAVWGTVIVVALVSRCRPGQSTTNPDLIPPSR